MFSRLTLSLFLLASTTVAQPAWVRSLGPGRNTSLPQNSARDVRGFDPSYRLKLSNPVQDKNFFLLSLFQRDPELRRLLSRNKVLKSLASQKLQALRRAANCTDVACLDQLLRLDEATIRIVASELTMLARRPEFKRLAMKEMRPSGVFIKYQPQPDSEMLVSAWKDAANGINRLLRVYCLGANPYYKDIDRISFDVSNPEYPKLLKTKIDEINLGRDALFFEPTLSFALKLLAVNRRDEAGRYEPLDEGENKAALHEMKQLRWNDYPYSFILVLGSGPGDSAPLSKIGAKRADQGAQLFLAHKAPLIILSGGHVHPMQTPFCEAIEMKKYLMEKYRIPESSILIDPYARHTTTNFRNAARLAFRYEMPADLKALVTSSEDHITLVTKDGFRIRCTTELGYFPIESISQISPITAEFKPSVVSLFFDANDPLDP